MSDLIPKLPLGDWLEEHPIEGFTHLAGIGVFSMCHRCGATLVIAELPAPFDPRPMHAIWHQAMDARR